MNITQRIEELKAFNVDRLGIDEMLLIRRDLSDLRAEYEAAGVEVPEWLTDQTGVVNTEVQRRTADDLKRQLKEIDAAERGLETATERRAKLAAQRKAIEAKLGITPVTT